MVADWNRNVLTPVVGLYDEEAYVDLLMAETGPEECNVAVAWLDVFVEIVHVVETPAWPKMSGAIEGLDGVVDGLKLVVEILDGLADVAETEYCLEGVVETAGSLEVVANTEGSLEVAKTAGSLEVIAKMPSDSEAVTETPGVLKVVPDTVVCFEEVVDTKADMEG